METHYHIHIDFTLKQLFTTILRIALTSVVIWTIVFCPWLIWGKFPFFEYQADFSQYCVSAMLSTTVCIIFGLLFKLILSGNFHFDYSITVALMLASLYAIYALVGPTLNGVQYNQNAAMSIYRLMNVIFIMVNGFLLKRIYSGKQVITSIIPFLLLILGSYSGTIIQLFVTGCIMAVVCAGGFVINQLKKRWVLN